jgi:hypothetical protein
VERDFRELLEAFNGEKVRYLVVGGYAVTKYTEPRYTKDLDVWVSPDEENAGSVFSALSRFGAPLRGLSPKDFSEKGFFYTIGMAPLRIDILFDLKGLDFEDCYRRRVESDLGGLAVKFISAEDLIITKEALARHQDLADAEKLRIARGRIRPGPGQG